MVSVFAFVIGYERHIDLQRNFAGKHPEILDNALYRVFPFFLSQYSVVFPIVAIIWLFAIEPTGASTFFVLSIVLSEHLSNFTYQMAVVDSRYIGLISITVIKNLVFSVCLAYIEFFTSAGLTFEIVLKLWAFVSLIASVAMISVWFAIKAKNAHFQSHDLKLITKQYKVSFYHFCIGLLALGTIQLDRVIVSTLLPLDEIGLFFRHVLVISFGYQIFNIAIFNRVLPVVFKHSRSVELNIIRRELIPEYIKVFVLALLASLFLIITEHSVLKTLFEKFELSSYWCSILLLGFLIRACADFSGLLYNAHKCEKYLFQIQLLSLLISLPVFILFTLTFGVVGTLFSSVINATIYFLLLEFRMGIVKTENKRRVHGI